MPEPERDFDPPRYPKFEALLRDFMHVNRIRFGSELARRCGDIDAGVACRWVRGDTRPSGKYLAAFQDVTGFTAAQIFADTPEESASPAPDAPGDTESAA